MLRKINTILSIFDTAEKQQFWRIQTLIVARSLSETINLLFIWQLISVTMDPTLIEHKPIYQMLFQWLGLISHQQFVAVFFGFYLLILIANSLIGVLNIKQQHRFIHLTGMSIGYKLFCRYLSRNYLYHIYHNSTTLTKRITIESQRFMNQVLFPLVSLNSNLLLMAFIILTLFVVDPLLVLSFSLLLVSFYVAIYLLIKKRVAFYGRQISALNSQRQKLIAESLNGIKEILLSHNQEISAQRLLENGKRLGRFASNNMILGQAPRFLVEFIVMGGIALSSLLVLLPSGDGVAQLIPKLSLYAVAIFKLIPPIQQIYAHTTQIRGNLHSFYEIKKDLDENIPEQTAPQQPKRPLQHAIELHNIAFTFPGSSTKAIDNISLVIPANRSVALVGSSGAGKSTLFDILLGLLRPDQGKILVDGAEMNDSSWLGWQKNMGYVAQDIYLIDGTIAENIAFGTLKQTINIGRVYDAMHLAQLDQLVQGLDDGIDSVVGEQGIKLSGGQKQRIGIARALYKDAQLLLLDEATNALDGLTEKAVMDTLRSFAHKKTMIIITHRLNTVKHCDTIYLLDEGRIIDHGAYDDLKNKNKAFAKMVDLS